jgi:RimJ/RimL family protein N-acetyltransferase
MGTNPPTTIETERLLLRQWRPEDRAPYAALNADPEVMEHFPATLTQAESDAMVDRMMSILADTGRGLWATEVKETATFIGFIGLNLTRLNSVFPPRLEIGWRLAKQAWGHGYAPEGATAVLAFAFERVELLGDEVISFTTEANAKSRRVMEKIGLIHDPARDFYHPDLAEWSGCRHVLYAIDRHQWESTVQPAR